MREDEEVRFLFHYILCRVLLRIGNLVLVGVAVDWRAGFCMGAPHVRLSRGTSDAVYRCRGSLLCFSRGTLDSVHEKAAYGSVKDS